MADPPTCPIAPRSQETPQTHHAARATAEPHLGSLERARDNPCAIPRRLWWEANGARRQAAAEGGACGRKQGTR